MENVCCVSESRGLSGAERKLKRLYAVLIAQVGKTWNVGGSQERSAQKAGKVI